MFLSKVPRIYNRFHFRRKIMSSHSFSSKVVEDLQTNPYYAKYAEKIAKLQNIAPEEFAKRKEEVSTIKEKSCTKRFEPLSKPKEPLSASLSPTGKSLADIFKVELTKDKSSEEIKEIWLQYHIQKDVIAATIPTEIYEKVAQRMKAYPIFLFPLPRSQGYEFFVSQVSGDEVHVTTLLCYQVHKENAPECLTLVHYKELSDKGLILMRGEYDKNVLDGMEAQCIANQFQMYYGQDHPSKLALLQSFTNHPHAFKHMDLISEMENIQLRLNKQN